MKMKRLFLCMMMSLALIVTFIPMISFAQDEENNDHVLEEDIQTNALKEPNKEKSTETKSILDNQVSDDKKIQLIKAYENQHAVHGASYADPVYDDIDDPFIVLYYPEPSCTYYLDQTMKLDFDVYDSWTDYYTIPVIGILDANNNLIDVIESDIADVDKWTEYTGSLYLNPSKYHSGTYGFIVFNVPCDSNGYYVEGWDEWNNVPNVSFYFDVACMHSWRQAVQDAAGYLKNGTVCDQCSICGAVTGSRTIPGWSTKYVKSAKVKKGKGSLTVKWKKQSKKNLKKFDGYEIRYSTSGDINTAKAITVSKKSKSKKIGKLAKKTKYYVWICSYKNVNGVRNYSNWKWGTVKTK